LDCEWIILDSPPSQRIIQDDPEMAQGVGLRGTLPNKLGHDKFHLPHIVKGVVPSRYKRIFKS
jgi:hypothetical protein